MRLSISDQQQPRPYLAPFNHNTSVTDRQTTTMPIARPLLTYFRLKRKGGKESDTGRGKMEKRTRKIGQG